MKLLVTILPLVVTVYAQTQSPLIPQQISGGCTKHLVNLDNNPQIRSYTEAFTNVVANFGAGSNSSNASASAINSALDTLCKNLSPYSQDTILTELVDFSTNCTGELTTSPNADVIRLYNVFYVIYPMSKAICTKDDGGKYCVLGLNTTANSTISSSPNDLWQPVTSNAIAPNLDQFKKDSLIILGIQPSLPANQLCQTCTRNVLKEYIQFTSDVDYAPGNANSGVMGSEGDLYSAVKAKCDPSFMGGTVQAAGGISGGILGNGATDLSVNTRTVAGALSAMIIGFFIAL